MNDLRRQLASLQDALHGARQLDADERAALESVLDDIQQGYQVLHLLEGDLFEIQEEEDERRREWIVDRDVGPIEERPQRMPWLSSGEDDRRFSKSLRATLLIALFLGVVVPLVPMLTLPPTPPSAEFGTSDQGPQVGYFGVFVGQA